MKDTEVVGTRWSVRRRYRARRHDNICCSFIYQTVPLQQRGVIDCQKKLLSASRRPSQDSIDI
jgi:hypothetical protein